MRTKQLVSAHQRTFFPCASTLLQLQGREGDRGGHQLTRAAALNFWGTTSSSTPISAPGYSRSITLRASLAKRRSMTGGVALCGGGRVRGQELDVPVGDKSSVRAPSECLARDTPFTETHRSPPTLWEGHSATWRVRSRSFDASPLLSNGWTKLATFFARGAPWWILPPSKGSGGNGLLPRVGADDAASLPEGVRIGHRRKGKRRTASTRRSQ